MSDSILNDFSEDDLIYLFENPNITNPLIFDGDNIPINGFICTYCDDILPSKLNFLSNYFNNKFLHELGEDYNNSNIVQKDKYELFFLGLLYFCMNKSLFNLFEIMIDFLKQNNITLKYCCDEYDHYSFQNYETWYCNINEQDDIIRLTLNKNKKYILDLLDIINIDDYEHNYSDISNAVEFMVDKYKKLVKLDTIYWFEVEEICHFSNENLFLLLCRIDEELALTYFKKMNDNYIYFKNSQYHVPLYDLLKYQKI